MATKSKSLRDIVDRLHRSDSLFEEICGNILRSADERSKTDGDREGGASRKDTISLNQIKERLHGSDAFFDAIKSVPSSVLKQNENTSIGGVRRASSFSSNHDVFDAILENRANDSLPNQRHHILSHLQAKTFLRESYRSGKTTDPSVTATQIDDNPNTFEKRGDVALAIARAEDALRAKLEEKMALRAMRSSSTIRRLQVELQAANARADALENLVIRTSGIKAKLHLAHARAQARLSKKRLAVEELVNNERAYVKTLKMVVETLLKPLRTMNQDAAKPSAPSVSDSSSPRSSPSRKTISNVSRLFRSPSTSELDDIFSNIEDVLVSAEAFLKAVENAVVSSPGTSATRSSLTVNSSDAALTSLAETVMTFHADLASHDVDVMKRYMTNFMRTTHEAVERATKKYPCLKMMAALTGQRDLESSLVIPIQRLPRRVLLLKEIQKYVHETQTCHRSLARAIDAVKDMLAECEGHLNRSKLQELQDAEDNSTHSLLDTGSESSVASYDSGVDLDDDSPPSEDRRGDGGGDATKDDIDIGLGDDALSPPAVPENEPRLPASSQRQSVAAVGLPPRRRSFFGSFFGGSGDLDTSPKDKRGSNHHHHHHRRSHEATVIMKRGRKFVDEGKLLRRGSSTFARFRERWIYLFDDCLMYSQSKGTGILGTYSLDGATVEPVGEADFALVVPGGGVDKKKKKKKKGGHRKTKDQIRTLFRANGSKCLRDRWVRLISEQIRSSIEAGSLTATTAATVE